MQKGQQNYLKKILSIFINASQVKKILGHLKSKTK